MSVQERDQFEQKLAGDSSLQAELGKWEPVYELVRLKARADLKSRLMEMDDEKGPVKPLWSRPIIWSVAAAVLVLFLVGIWWTSQSVRYSPDSLVSMNLDPYEAPVQLRDDRVSPWEQATTAFREGRYEEAALGFEQLLTDSVNPTDVTQFYAGHSFLLADDPEKAVLYLSPVVEGRSPYREPARWYRALAYLKLGLIESSREDLNLLERYRTDDAVEILRKLDQ